MKRIVFLMFLFLFVFVGAAAASRPVASATGVVVAKERGALLVASPGGVVRTVSGRAAVGARVLVTGAHVSRVVGVTTKALIEGVVVRRTGSLLFLSAAHRLLAVHLGARRLASATDAPAAPGTVVQETVGIDDQGELDDQGEQQLGQSNQVQVQAQITGVGAGTVTLSVNGQPLTITLPAGLTLPSTVVGTQVTLNLSFANGQMTADEQGDNSDNQPASGSDQGSSSSSSN
jgi:hypothetical protein